MCVSRDVTLSASTKRTKKEQARVTKCDTLVSTLPGPENKDANQGHAVRVSKELTSPDVSL